MNSTNMLLAVVYFLLKSISFPFIIFMVSILLVTLITLSHPVIQGRTHMLSFLRVVECWHGMVLIEVSSMSLAVVI